MIDGQIKLKHSEITDKILHAFYKVVYPQLGYGFLEKVYENALVIALTAMGLKVQQQVRSLCIFKSRLSANTSRICWSRMSSSWS